jgi:hypothetical protein
VPRTVRIAGVVARRADEPHLSCDPQADRDVLLVGHGLDKEPADTWRQYGPLLRTYSTRTITPELLAALAQIAGRIS